jgi:hypothetical protein
MESVLPLLPTAFLGSATYGPGSSWASRASPTGQGGLGQAPRAPALLKLCGSGHGCPLGNTVQAYLLTFLLPTVFYGCFQQASLLGGHELLKVCDYCDNFSGVAPSRGAGNHLPLSKP